MGKVMKIKVEEFIKTRDITVEDIDEISRFMGCRPEQMCAYVIQYSHMHVHVGFLAIEKTIKETYKLHEPANSNRINTTYVQSQGEKGFTLGEGVYFIESINGSRLIISAELRKYSTPRTFVIKIYVRKDQADIAKHVFNEIENNMSCTKKTVLDDAGKCIPFSNNLGWDSIVLNPTVLEQIRSNTENIINNIDDFNNYNIPTKRGLIFYGPPGNGKTLMLKIIASSCNANAILLSAKSLSAYGPEIINILYGLARSIKPCFVFIEDIDFILLSRDIASPLTKEYMNEFLNQLDGFTTNDGIITIATTNDIDVLDKAIGDRPGRFDLRIEFPNPEPESRLKLLKLYTKNVLLESETLLEHVAEQTAKLSCTKINELVIRAKMMALQEGCIREGKIFLKKNHLLETDIFKNVSSNKIAGFSAA